MQEDQSPYDDSDWGVEPSQEKKKLMQQFETLSPINAAIQYAKELSKYLNTTYSCQKTLCYIMQGLRLRQKVPFELIQIDENEKQLEKLEGGVHPYIQQRLRKADYFALGILAKGSDGVFLRNTGRLIELENDKYIIKKYQPIDLCGNHFILFHRPNSQKDIYYVYQSWQSEFSLEYWMQKSDQFQSISIQLFEEKVFPYEDPLKYLTKYFHKMKEFKITQKSCPSCNYENQQCRCSGQYQLLIDKQYEQALENFHKKLEELGVQRSPQFQSNKEKFKQQVDQTSQITIQQFAWGKRLKYFNVLKYYMTSEVK